MNRNCVVVRLTRNTIEFRYQLDNCQVEFLNHNNDGSEIPLAFYQNGEDLVMGNYALERAAMNDSNAFINYFKLIKDTEKTFYFCNKYHPIAKLLYLGVENYLYLYFREILHISDSTISEIRETFPLRFCFTSDLNKEERQFVIDLFVKSGYSNTREVIWEESLFSIISPEKRGKMLLSGLGGDLFIGYYPTSSVMFSMLKVVEGAGSDPRFRLCADMIFDEILKVQPWLSAQKRNNWTLLLNEASNVIQSNMPIYLGDIIFDTGEKCGFQINQKYLQEQLNNGNNSQTMISELSYFVQSLGIHPSDIDIILYGDVNTEYFANKLHQKYPNVINISNVQFIQTWNRIFSSVDLSSQPIMESQSLERPTMDEPKSSISPRPTPPLPPSASSKQDVSTQPKRVSGAPIPPPKSNQKRSDPHSNQKEDHNVGFPPPPPPQSSNLSNGIKSLGNIVGDFVGSDTDDFIGDIGTAINSAEKHIKERVGKVSSALRGIGSTFASMLNVKREFVVGRSGDQSFVITDRTVSRQHCRITQYYNDEFLIENLSPNGTYINGKKTERGTAQINDRIGLGPNFVVKLKDLLA